MIKNRVKKLETVCEGLSEAEKIIPIMTQIELIALGAIDKDHLVTKWTPHLREVWTKYQENHKKDEV